MVQILSPSGLEKPEGGELHSRAQYLRNLDRMNQIAADNAKLAKGFVAYTELSGNTGTINTLMVVLNIASFTFKANRRYRVGASGGGYSNVTNATYGFSINRTPVTETATSTANLDGLKSRSFRWDIAGEGREAFGVAKENLMFTTDTTLQIKLTAAAVVGTGNLVLTSDATNRICLWVEDCGVAF